MTNIFFKINRLNEARSSVNNCAATNEKAQGVVFRMTAFKYQFSLLKKANEASHRGKQINVASLCVVGVMQSGWS